MNDTPNNSNPAVSRLGVGHLLMWTAGCAVALAIDRAFSRFVPHPRPPSFASQAVQIEHAVAYGAALAILAIFAWNRLRWRLVEAPQPGHWLLLIASTG